MNLKKSIMVMLFFMLTCVFSSPVESLTPNGFTSPFQIRVDRQDRFEFRIDTPAAPVYVRVCPEKMRITKGNRYWVEPTVQRPFEVTAEKDGELRLSFDRVPYQYVGIFPARNQLLRHTCIEVPVKTKTGASFPDGKGGTIWEKSRTRGLFRAVIDKDISLIPGKKYRLTYGFRFSYNPGILNSFFYPVVEIHSETGKKIRFRDVVRYRLGNYSDGDGYIRFTVPSDWKTATATLVIAGEFGPMKVHLTAFDLREASEPMRNHPRHHGTSYQYSVSTNEKNLLAKLLARKNYTVDIERYAERPVLNVNGRRMPFTSTSSGYGAVVREFAEAGYTVSWVPIRMAAFYRYRRLEKNPIWKGLDSYDFSQVDKALKNHLLYVPDQPVMLAVALYPYPDYTKDFPGAAWREHDGSKIEMEHQKGKYFHSITGEIYRRETGKVLRKLGEYVRNSVYGKNVIGIHLCDGGDGQWYDWSHSDWTRFHFDYSEESRREIIYLLRRRYHDDIDALRKAWDMPEARFDTLQIPKPKEWEPFFMTLMDPSIGAQKRLIDFGQVYNDAIVHSIDSAHQAFEEGIGRKVVGLVYFSNDSCGALLNSRYIDGIVSVPFYHDDRALCSANFCEQSAGSFRIHNKFFLTEMDHRSDYSELGCRIGGFDRTGLAVPVGGKALANQLRRDFSLSMTQGQSAWVCTIAGFNTWSEEFFTAIGEYSRAQQAALDYPAWWDWGAISFFTDYKAKRNSGRSYGFGYNTDRLPRKAIMHSGIGFSDYVLEDIGNPRLHHSRIYFFANAINLTSQQVDYIVQNYQKKNNILVFSFGTALNTPGGFEKNIKKLTGMTVRKNLSKLVYFQYAEKKSTDPLAHGFGEITVERGEKIPLFHIDDSSATPLAWHESNPDLVAAAVKRHKDWTGIYLANGYFSQEFPRALAKEAGVLPVGPLGDVTLAGNSIVTIHAAASGLKTIQFPKKVKLIDLITGRICGYMTDSYTFPMKAGETRWFKVR